MEWFFDGIGTEIVAVIISLILGGTMGYVIGVNKNIQKQKARDNGIQVQIGGNKNGK